MCRITYILSIFCKTLISVFTQYGGWLTKLLPQPKLVYLSICHVTQLRLFSLPDQCNVKRKHQSFEICKCCPLQVILWLRLNIKIKCHYNAAFRSDSSLSAIRLTGSVLTSLPIFDATQIAQVVKLSKSIVLRTMYWAPWRKAIFTFAGF